MFPTLQQLLCKPSYKLEKRAATVTGETHPEEMSAENLPMLTDAALLLITLVHPDLPPHPPPFRALPSLLPPPSHKYC